MNEKLTNLRHACLGSLTIALALGLTSAKADLIDVNFYSSTYGGSTASGAAVVGSASDTWNGIAADSGVGSALGLVDVNNNPTSVSLAYASAAGGAVHSLAPNIQPNASLMYDYLFNNDGTGILVTLTGLAPSSRYDLYVYLASNDATGSDRAATVAANLALGTATGNPETTFSEGDNYLLLTPVSTPLGTISISELVDLAANTSGEVDLNGLQIQSVPDGCSTLPLLALSGLGLVLFTRRTSRTVPA